MHVLIAYDDREPTRVHWQTQMITCGRRTNEILRAAASMGFVTLAAGAGLMPLHAQPMQQSAASPDFPESVATLAAGSMQFELGSTYGLSGEWRSLSAGEAMLRAGLSNRIELQVLPASLMVQMSPSDQHVGFQDSGIGLKFALRQWTQGASPLSTAVSLNVGASLPTGHEYFRSRHALPRAKMLTSWNFSTHVNFTAELGWTRAEAEGSLIDAWTSTAALAVTAKSGASVYTEFLSAGTRISDWDRGAFATVGISYLLTRAVQVDVRAGVRTDHPSDGTFYHVGIARIF